MSEVASVNIDAVAWPEPDVAYFAVRKMQIRPAGSVTCSTSSVTQRS
jgi:hypothetical protein